MLRKDTTLFIVVFLHFFIIATIIAFCTRLFLKDIKGRKNGVFWLRPERLFSNECIETNVLGLLLHYETSELYV